MDERLLNRRFNSALTSEQAQVWDPESIVEEAEHNEEAALRKLDAPMDAKDAIKRILLAKKDKDYFRCLGCHVTIQNPRTRSSDHSPSLTKQIDGGLTC